MNKKYLRLFLGAVTPPFMGGALFLIYGIFKSNEPLMPISELTRSIIGVLALSYIFMGFQSLVYSFAIEYLIFPYTNSKVVVISFSIFMGFIMSLLIFVDSLFLKINTVMPLIGVVTGFVVGLILYKLAPEPEF